MLLRNYDNLVALCALPNAGLGKTLGDATAFSDEHLCLKDISGALKRVYHYFGSSAYGFDMPFKQFTCGSTQFADISIGHSTIVAGNGDTPVTYDDYKLENIFTNTQVQKISHSVGDVIYNEADNTWEKTYYCVCLAKEDLTVKEIGIYAKPTQTTSSSSAYSALVYRKVLDAPVEVPANANFVLSFTVKVSANSSKPADYDATASM